MQTSFLEEARRAAAITARYYDLQGLRQVAGGAMVLVAFAWSLLFPVTFQDIRDRGASAAMFGAAVLCLAFGGMVAGVRAVSSWYNRRYGRIGVTSRQRRTFVVVAGVGAASFLVPFEAEILVHNAGGVIPVNILVLGLSLGVLGYWFYLGRTFLHYFVLAGIGLALTVASASGIAPNSFVWHMREALLFLGFASIVGGLIDHRILSQALSSRKELGINA